ncbi:hypothetical protein GCM10022397_44340 [Flavivirga jejuensis]
MAYGCESKPLVKYKSIGSGTKCKYLIPIKADLILKFRIGNGLTCVLQKEACNENFKL